MEQRLYWLEMGYRCNACSLSARIWLEQGVEGPREISVAWPEEMKRAWRRARVPGWEPGRGTIAATLSGRVIVPAPFLARGCPKCQSGGPPWKYGQGVLIHSGPDRRLGGVPLDTTQADYHFVYPGDPYSYMACGELRPVS